MSLPVPQRLRELINRLSRLSEADDRDRNLTPAQAAVLGYLVAANRYSRAPSQVADYLGATRGTVSQTLKLLARKGWVVASAAAGDGRSITYAATPEGQRALADPGAPSPSLQEPPPDRLDRIERDLESLLRDALAARGGRSFGLCRTCRHHAPRPDGAWCRLLAVALRPEDSGLICHEHLAA